MMRTRRPVTLTEKSDRDLVSDVDVAIERAIRHRLATASPGIAFLGAGRHRRPVPGPSLPRPRGPGRLRKQHEHRPPGRRGAHPAVGLSTARLRDAVVAIGDYAVGEDADRKNAARLAATSLLVRARSSHPDARHRRPRPGLGRGGLEAPASPWATSPGTPRRGC